MFEDEVRQTSDKYYEAVNQMFQGDLKLIEEIWSHAPDITAAGPLGVIYTGWDEVHELLQRESGLNIKGTIHPRDMLIRVTGDLAFTVCVEEGDLTMGDQSIHLSLRATNVYRREYGFWKLVHHHSDYSETLVEAARQQEEALLGANM